MSNIPGTTVRRVKIRSISGVVERVYVQYMQLLELKMVNGQVGSEADINPHGPLVL